MEYTQLGKTGLKVSRSGFGALPLQRISDEDADVILREAFEAGITFYDTARIYLSSEAKIGRAFHGVRDKIVIATKSPAEDGASLMRDLEQSLRELRTDHVELFQFHLAKKCHRPGESDGLYDAIMDAKKKGMVLHIGITTHRRHVAQEAAESGSYETVQFPFSYLSDDIDHALVKRCEEKGIGYIAMKALSGGLITDPRAAFAYMRRFKNVIPIWGIQRLRELHDFIACENDPPALDEEMMSKIEADRRELTGNFCRSCGYCMPCPVGIELFQICRMPQTLRRMEPAVWLTDEWKEKMELTKKCIHCGRCAKKCPYELVPEELIRKAYEDYFAFEAEWRAKNG